MRDVTMQSMKSKSVHICQFVHHAHFHCIMATLYKFFNMSLKGGGGTGKEPICVLLRLNA